MEQWFEKTRIQAELKEITIELRSQDGRRQALVDVRRRIPRPVDRPQGRGRARTAWARSTSRSSTQGSSGAEDADPAELRARAAGRRRRGPDRVRVQPAGVLDHQDQRLHDQAGHRHRRAEARVRRRHAVDDPRSAPARLVAARRGQVDQGRRDQAAEDDGDGRRRGRRRLGPAVRDLQVGLRSRARRWSAAR